MNRKPADEAKKLILFKLSPWLLGLLLIGHVLFNLLTWDAQQQANITEVALLIEQTFGVVLMYYAARLTRRYQPEYAPSWYLWMCGYMCAILGNMTWIAIEIVLHQSPFPSIADLFFLLFYILVGVGLTKYPREKYRVGEIKFAHLDNVIVVLGAGLGFWYLLIGSRGVSETQDLLATLLALVYPILDIFMLWMILIFFRSHTRQSTYGPLIMFALSCLCAISSDLLFAYKEVHQLAIQDTWINFGWVVGALILIFAGTQQVKNLYTGQPESIRQRPGVQPQSHHAWPVYLPYFWLVIAFIVLSTNLVKNNGQLSLYLVVGLIIALVIFRQVMTLTENERLFQQAQVELEERKQAQEALRQANLALDERVRQRTEELNSANGLLIQSNQKLETSLHDKEVLLKEIHHRVKNNLQTVSSLLSLQSRLIQDPAARAAFQESQMRVQSMALIHEKLYQSQNLSEVNLHPYIENLVAILFRSYQTQAGHIQLTTQIEDIAVGIDTAVPVGLILNEMISNAFKHAFPDGRSGAIHIQLVRESPEWVRLSCRDNGCGMPEGLELRASKSLGLQLVNSLAHQLMGELSVERSSGTQFLIRLPVAAAPPMGAALTEKRSVDKGVETVEER